jgi:hypothetical protein
LPDLQSVVRKFLNLLSITKSKPRIQHLVFFCLFSAFCLLYLPCAGHAGTASVAIGWEASSGNVAGYEVCYGRSSGNYDYSVDVGNSTSCTISGLEKGIPYYFAVKAYTSESINSEFSEELVHTIPLMDEGPGSFADIVLQAEDLSYHANGMQSGEDWLLWSNGTMSDRVEFPQSGLYRFEIMARGRLAHGIGPEMELIIGGISKGTVFVNTTNHDIFEFDVELSAGSHEVAVGFNNDYYDKENGIDRNLYVDYIVIYLVQANGFPQDDPPQADAPSNNIAIEAENGILNSPFDYSYDSSASSEGFIWVPNGSGNCYDPNKESGYAEYNFKVSTSGNYVIWGRIQAANTKDNSFFVSIDGKDYSLWDTKSSKSWVWDAVSNRDGADPVSFYLEGGEHTLKIKQREDGTKLDKMIITIDPAYIPTGLADEISPQDIPEAPDKNINPEAVKVWLEAESGYLYTPMAKAGDADAAAGKYIWVAEGSGRVLEATAPSGYAEYTFEVPVSGNYRIWGRIKAADTNDNSFFVSVDGAEYALWDTPVSKTWLWDPVADRGGDDPVIFSLDAGKHTLIVKLREDGTKLDRILVTGDMEYIPE